MAGLGSRESWGCKDLRTISLMKYAGYFNKSDLSCRIQEYILNLLTII